ncbi:hypothetical protein RRG08_064154 [Elysia crispata]|uniref:Uncharacterized protein n=1 Tax=Elysia crispata TaxID=231223 RepID=A0AAE1DIK1_9GAST|nr:hypothetical protein RRG08_064154 [Elysia crispata]
MQYGTAVVTWEAKWRWFRWLRILFCSSICYLDQSVVEDARERMDRRRRGSPAAAVRVERAAEIAAHKEDSHSAGIIQPAAGFSHEWMLRQISGVDEQLLLGSSALRPHSSSSAV